MPLGFPAVTPLRAERGTEVGQRIEAIRQRLKALDDEVTRLGSVADATNVAVQVTSLQRALLTLQQRVSTLEAAIGVTDTLTLAAGETIAAYQVVVPGAPNQCVIADPSDPRSRNVVLGVATNGGAAGQAIAIQRRGQLTVLGQSFETGRPVFLGPAGTLTQDPTYGSAAIAVGVAMSSTVLWIGAGDPVLLTPTNYPDVFDDAMPVAWGVVSPYIRLLEQLLLQPNGFVVLVDGELGTTGSITGAP